MADLKPKTETKLYWAKAARFILGNFIPEKKNSLGEVVQQAMGIEFQEHIFSTDDLKKIKFIEESKAFARGQIKLCANEHEAHAHSHAHRVKRAGVVKTENLMAQDVYEQH